MQNYSATTQSICVVIKKSLLLGKIISKNTSFYTMPANKNALIRYKTIDNCLRRRHRQWTLNDLVEACSDAIYDAEGITRGVSVRTVQSDIQMMRSDKLGYNAPIEVYDHKYYRYSDPDFSISNMPLSQNDYEVLNEAVDMLRQLEDFDQFAEMSDVIGRLQEKLLISKENRAPIIHFDSVPNLKGLKLLNPIYNYILKKQPIVVKYKPYATDEMTLIFHPYLLKEFRNRWFLIGCKDEDLTLFNFALDRIVSVEPATDVEYKENPRFNKETFYDDVVGVSKNINNHPMDVVFWASNKESNYIKTKPIHKSQTIVKEDENGTTFKIRVVVNYELYSIFSSYTGGVRIISPDFAVRHMKRTLQHTLSLYDDNDSQ